MTALGKMTAAELHERVRAACWDSLTGQLVMLHQPHSDAEGIARCHGCDREPGGPGTDNPRWPCRTYLIMATSVLAKPDIESLLDHGAQKQLHQ